MSPHAQMPLIALRSHFLIPALLYILKEIYYAYCLRKLSINSPPDPTLLPAVMVSHCALAPTPFRLQACLFPYLISTWGVWEWGLLVRIYNCVLWFLCMPSAYTARCVLRSLCNFVNKVSTRERKTSNSIQQLKCLQKRKPASDQ